MKSEIRRDVLLNRLFTSSCLPVGKGCRQGLKYEVGCKGDLIPLVITAIIPHRSLLPYLAQSFNKGDTLVLGTNQHLPGA